jgi:hypothetical protein
MAYDPPQPTPGPDDDPELTYERPPAGHELHDPTFPGDVTPQTAMIGAGAAGGFLVALVTYLKRRRTRHQYDELDE